MVSVAPVPGRLVTALTARPQDVTNHPTWTGGKVVTQDDGQVARFRRRYQHQLQQQPGGGESDEGKGEAGGS